MKFKPGNPKPPGSGRKKGQVSKTALLVREALEAKGFNLVNEIMQRLPELSKVEQVDALIKLMPYCYPKLSNVEVNAGNPDERILAEAQDEDINTILAEARKIQ